MKYTKGPWQTQENWIMQNDLHIATIAKAYDGDFSEANARLISCAPEMLELLIESYKSYELQDYYQEKIVALIEKATGSNIEEVLNNGRI